MLLSLMNLSTFDIKTLVARIGGVFTQLWYHLRVWVCLNAHNFLYKKTPSQSKRELKMNSSFYNAVLIF